jgi:hypothetical protein
MKDRIACVSLLLVFLALLCSPPAHAEITVFTNRSAFLAATNGLSQEALDFENIPVGTTVTSGTAIEGVTFQYSIDGFNLMVDDEFYTTSGTKYLGLDSVDGAFLSGDTLTMIFEHPIHAVGLFMIGVDILAGDFELGTNAGSGVNSGIPDTILPDGQAFFLGLVQTDPQAGFTRAELKSVDPGFGDFFLFNLDFIVMATVPCQGDLDQDGDVDGSDLALFTEEFGRTNCVTNPPCHGDLDEDGDVDGSDLAVFAGEFGRANCPSLSP